MGVFFFFCSYPYGSGVTLNILMNHRYFCVFFKEKIFRVRYLFTLDTYIRNNIT